MNKKQELDSSLSLSKQRKIQRKKEIEHQKRQAKINKLIGICIIALVVIGLASYGGYKIYIKANEIKASSDYSKGLDDNGFIKGVTAKDKINLCDYKNISVPLKDVEYSDESVNKDIEAALTEHQALNKKSTATIKDGDKVNLDYVGNVDGQEFEGGNSNGEGYDLTIGSNSFVDDFEEQMIGHKVGDKFAVTVTFPSDYREPTLAGKEATFDVVINGIFEKPEFNDAFVKENFKDQASTADEYRQYLKDTNYDKSLTTWVTDYLQKETTVKSYPEDYLKQLARTLKQDDINMYNTMNSYLGSMGGQQYKSFSDYINQSMVKYDKDLKKKAKTKAKENMIYQAILENEGITLTEADYKEYSLGTGTTEEVYKQQVELYGTGYSVQKLVKERAIEIVKGLVKVQ